MFGLSVCFSWVIVVKNIMEVLVNGSREGMGYPG